MKRNFGAVHEPTSVRGKHLDSLGFMWFCTTFEQIAIQKSKTVFLSRLLEKHYKNSDGFSDSNGPDLPGEERLMIACVSFLQSPGAGLSQYCWLCCPILASPPTVSTSAAPLYKK